MFSEDRCENVDYIYFLTIPYKFEIGNNINTDVLSDTIKVH